MSCRTVLTFTDSEQDLTMFEHVHEKKIVLKMRTAGIRLNHKLEPHACMRCSSHEPPDAVRLQPIARSDSSLPGLSRNPEPTVLEDRPRLEGHAGAQHSGSGSNHVDGFFSIEGSGARTYLRIFR